MLQVGQAQTPHKPCRHPLRARSQAHKRRSKVRSTNDTRASLPREIRSIRSAISALSYYYCFSHCSLRRQGFRLRSPSRYRNYFPLLIRLAANGQGRKIAPIYARPAGDSFGLTGETVARQPTCCALSPRTSINFQIERSKEVLNLDSEQIEQAAQEAFDRAGEAPKFAARWQRAIARAKGELLSNPYIHWADNELLILSPTTDTIYQSNGVCQCIAYEKGFPCWHRAAARIVERALSH
jgi:hypothetical protein